MAAILAPTGVTRVAGIFAGLKWRLVASRFRAMTGATKVGVIVGFAVLLVLLVFAAIGLASLGRIDDIGPAAIGSLLTFQLVAWVITPMVAFGVDETVDPQRFALLPIRTRVLQRGLLVSSLIGYLPSANMILLVGAAVGLSRTAWQIPIALMAMAGHLVTCIVFSRAAATSMASLMSSRRGRDLGMLVGFGVVILYMGMSLVFNNNGGDSSGIGRGVRAIAEALAWGPPGQLSSLPSLFASGSWGRVALAVAIPVAFLALGWWWWSRALANSLTSVGSPTESSAPSRGIAGRDAVGSDERGTAGVVAGRDVSLMWRDPMRRMPWLIALLMSIAWPLIVVPAAGAAYACALGAVLLGAQAGNLYGVEGSGLWLHLVAFADRRRARGELLGHLAVVIVPSVILITLSVVVVSTIRDGWQHLPGALGVCFGALAGSTALGCYLSARMPFAMPQSRKSMFASSVPGQKGRTAIVTLALVFGGIMLAAPSIVFGVIGLVKDPAWGWGALIAAAIVGPIQLRVAVRLASERYLQDATEIFAVVKAGDRV